MDLRLDGLRALITGSSGGVGAAIAQQLALEGCRVIVHGRREGPAEEQAESIRLAGGHAEVLLGDVAVSGEPARLAATALEGGPVDVLVANAGPFAEHRFTEATDEDWTSAFAGNVLSAVGCARGVIPAMRNAGWGRIITLGTRGAATPLANMVEYSAAKAALINATGALAGELAGTGITANVVSPGVILTPGLREMFESRARAAGDDRSWEDLEPEVVADYAPTPSDGLVDHRTSPQPWPSWPARSPTTSPAQPCESTEASRRASTRSARMIGGGSSRGEVSCGDTRRSPTARNSVAL